MRVKFLLVFLVCIKIQAQDFQVSSHGSVIFEQHIAADSSGNFVVVWDDSRNIKAEKEKGTDGDVYGRRYNKQGSPLGSSFRISNDSLEINESFAGQYWPRLAMNNMGQFVVVWVDTRPNGTPLDDIQSLEHNIYFQRFDEKGMAVGSNYSVNDSLIGGQLNPDVIIREDGSFIVVWLNTFDIQKGTTRSFRVNMQCFNSDGAKINSNKKTELFSTLQPRIALFKNGNFVITADTKAQIFSFSGNGLGNPFNISAGTNKEIKISKDDILYITYTKSRIVLGNLTDFDVYVEAYNSTGVSIINEIKVNDDNTYSWQLNSTISIDSNKVLVAWEDYRNGYEETGDSFCKDIYSQRFDLNLRRIGSNIKLSHEKDESEQIAPALALRKGKIYLTWIDGRLEYPDKFPPISKMDIWATILDFNNPIEGTIIKCLSPYTRLDFTFFQSFPNPASSTITLVYDLLEDAYVKLVLYNSLGKKVKILLNRFQAPNRHYFTLFSDELANGIYFANITIKTVKAKKAFQKAVKITIIK